jgi:LysR family transcriptional regulator for metE and metH
MIEIKHLKTLQALRNCGSLAAAAATLHQTQSALSHQFSDLEQRLGFRLLCVRASRCALRRRGNPAAAGQSGAAADRQRPAGL